MKGNEVNELLKPESLITQDDNNNPALISTKLHVFNVAFHNLEAAFLRDIGDQDKNYDFIPFPCGAFVEMLIEASLYFKMDRTKKFLDIGAGPGSKVMLAQVLFDAYGLELKSNLVEMANRLGLKNVFRGDALKYEDYGDYDLLYFYRPFKSDPLQLALEEKIFDQMKPGAMIAPMHTVMDWDKKAKRMSKYLYLKEE